MQWLWFLAPALGGLIFMLTGQIDKRALREIEAWQEALGKRRQGDRSKSKVKDREAPKQPGKKDKTAYRELAEAPKDAPKKASKKNKKDLRPRKVAKLSPALARLAELVGGGRSLGDYEVLPKVAHATFVMGDLGGSSDHQTVLVELAEPAPAFTARPLPWVDGALAPNTGIEFRKDPEFAAAYVVDGAQAKPIGKWLTKPLREMLIESGEVWLRAEGKVLALSMYGSIRQEKIESLLEIADVFVAEHGAEGGPSLFGEEEDVRAARLDEADADEDEEDEEDAEDEDADDEGDEDNEEADEDASKSA